MSLEDQLTALTTQLTRIADALEANQSPVAAKTSPAGSKKAEKPAQPAKAEEPAPKAAEENPAEETPAEETATKALKEKPPKEETGTPEHSFEDCSKYFFTYLANARKVLGRQEAKDSARALLDSYQTQNGQPLDESLLPGGQRDAFYNAVDDAVRDLGDD